MSVTALSILALSLSAAPKPPAKPNIIYVLADDLAQGGLPSPLPSSFRPSPSKAGAATGPGLPGGC